MNRRRFLLNASLAAAAHAATPRSRLSASLDVAAAAPASRRFTTDDPALARLHDAALAALAANSVTFPAFSTPVLVEGSVYHGVWLECAPQEGAVYGDLGTPAARAIARNNHLIFFALQNAEGQLPYSVKPEGPGFAQIQMVVPIAATAWELARQAGDSELLDKAYAACSRWDAWLRRYRNTRGTGLCEGFCCWDTGQDNSPRWKGIPNTCPDRDARKCPSAPGLPRLCPDLSATVYGGRVALAAMAKALSKSSEADRWTEDAETIRHLILDRLYDPNDGAFYDLDANNQFVRVRGTAILRVLGEQVAPPAIFDNVWRLQAHNPAAFWAPYPFPSIALDDPTFVRPIPRNSWGGAAQALTALRAPRWMEHYGKPAELASMMQRWVEALMRASGPPHQQAPLSEVFRQQLDPRTGEFTQDDPGGYSPAALVLVDFLWRLSGVREHGELVEWNVHPLDRPARFSLPASPATLELDYDGARAELRIGGQKLARVSGLVRLLTTKTGQLNAAIGIADSDQQVTVDVTEGLKRGFRIAPNQRIELGP